MFDRMVKIMPKIAASRIADGLPRIRLPAPTGVETSGSTRQG
jgi:hypothetical protein